MLGVRRRCCHRRHQSQRLSHNIYQQQRAAAWNDNWRAHGSSHLSDTSTPTLDGMLPVNLLLYSSSSLCYPGTHAHTHTQESPLTQGLSHHAVPAALVLIPPQCRESVDGERDGASEGVAVQLQTTAATTAIICQQHDNGMRVDATTILQYAVNVLTYVNDDRVPMLLGIVPVRLLLPSWSELQDTTHSEQSNDSAGPVSHAQHKCSPTTHPHTQHIRLNTWPMYTAANTHTTHTSHTLSHTPHTHTHHHHHCGSNSR